jgi:hypothetical protein
MAIIDIVLSDKSKSSVKSTSISSMKYVDFTSANYGADFWSNILRLTENYSSVNPPNFPIEGQLWFNPNTFALNVATVDANKNVVWTIVSDVYDDTTVGYIDRYKRNIILNISVPATTEPTIYDGPYKTSNHAATKKFADEWHGGIVHGSDKICNWNIYGNAGGAIKLPFTMFDTNYAVILTNIDTASTSQYASSKTTTGFYASNNSWMVVGYKA